MLCFTVVSAPVILSPLQDCQLNAGKAARLECEVALGTPTATIRWYVPLNALTQLNCHPKPQ